MNSDQPQKPSSAPATPIGPATTKVAPKSSPTPLKLEKKAKPTPPPPPPPEKVPPLFRPIDWLALGICFVIVEFIYLAWMSPQVTLEDSGELCTGAFWAGIPHPPGYPFWAIYSWLWTTIVPFGNVAWRVELGQAAAMGMGCSLIAFMVSRGGSMLIESIDELRGIVGKWENAICLVCGVTAGLLFALDNTMWFESSAINRISEFGVPWLVIVLLCMLRWIYAPHQRGYLYTAMFFFGICATIHQTLVVAAMGIEIGIAVTQPKLGRDLFFGNCFIWMVLTFARVSGTWTSFQNATDATMLIFNVVGIASLLTAGWLIYKTGGLLSEWKACLWMGVVWMAGASFYFYEAIAGMTNPPMEWGYPRLVDGFFHALTRGQYQKIDPTDIVKHPDMFMIQLWTMVKGVAEAFNWVYMLLALLPFLFFFKLKRRERNWLVAVAAIYPFLGVLLTMFLNPQQDRQSAELLRVFFCASHAIVAILLGYGLVLWTSYMATNYQNFRFWGFIGGALALLVACICLVDVVGTHYRGLAGEASISEVPGLVSQAFAPNQYGLPIFAGLALIALPLIFLAVLAVYRSHAPLLITLGLVGLMPIVPGMAHWFSSEQKLHWFGYWFGHDMFTPPFKGPDGKLTYDSKLREEAMKGPNGYLVYPEMARDTVLYGGTDPGRFCPTYMIYCESFIPFSCQPEQDQHFDRRDVYLITQNAVADPTYLDYIRAQYNRSQQVDDPFFQCLLPYMFPGTFHEARTGFMKPLDSVFETIGKKIEWRRRTGTSWFKASDFSDVTKLGAALHGQQNELCKFLYGQLSPETQSLLTSGSTDSLAKALAKDFNKMLEGPTIYDPARFANIVLPPLIVKTERQIVADDSSQTPATRLRLNRRLLEEAFPHEIVKSDGGVYPDTEIIEPSLEVFDQSYNDFYADVQRRVVHDTKHPNEPKQMRGDEQIISDDKGHYQVSGEGAVMELNGLLTKYIFDKNPDHEFYEEESFPLDWMYPHLTPFSNILKINHENIAEITPEMIERDHKFWCDYMQRTIGDWITYDTSIKEICDFSEKVYVRHDYSGFKGDLKFIRDEDAQKSFSKLRNAVGESVYSWRAGLVNQSPVPPPISPEVRNRMLKEAEFALKQAVAMCPFSPEPVFHLLTLLSTEGRFDDMRMILQTCHDLDPYNTQVSYYLDLVKKQLQAGNAVTPQQALDQVGALINAGQTNQAAQMLDVLARQPEADGGLLVHVAELNLNLHRYSAAADAMDTLVKKEPGRWESWLYRAKMQALNTNAAGAAESLGKAFSLNPSEAMQDPHYTNMHDYIDHDPFFAPIRGAPEYLNAMARKNSPAK